MNFPMFVFWKVRSVFQKALDFSRTFKTLRRVGFAAMAVVLVMLAAKG